MELNYKLNILKSNLKELGSVGVAFSGGVDSTLLLKVASDVLGSRAVAITLKSPTFAQREYDEAVDFARLIGARHIVINGDDLEIEGFSDNPVDRCYICKKAIFTDIIKAARENNIEYVIDGSNIDDDDDYRPGKKALKELGVISPLKDAGMTKEDIRVLSRKMDLPTWDKPAFACLSTRFPYGQKITKEKLVMVDRAEQYLHDIGLKQVRVRHHGDIARIEVSPYDRSRFFDEELMDRIYDKFREIGFMYTSLDLKGYRMGSMNETLEM